MICNIVIIILLLYIYIYVTPRVHILPQLVGAGLEPGIPVREAGALTSNAKGYTASSVSR